MRTLVLGLGNAILSDDGAGIRVAEAVKERMPGSAVVDVREVCIGGLRLMEEMIGYDHVILVDSYLSPGGKPGAVHRFTLDDLRSVTPTEHSFSPHDASLTVAYDMGLRMGLSLPGLISIYAIEVTNVSDFSEQLTPEVEQAVERVTQAVLDELAVSEAVHA